MSFNASGLAARVREPRHTASCWTSTSVAQYVRSSPDQRLVDGLQREGIVLGARRRACPIAPIARAKCVIARRAELGLAGTSPRGPPVGALEGVARLHGRDRIGRDEDVRVVVRHLHRLLDGALGLGVAGLLEIGVPA